MAWLIQVLALGAQPAWAAEDPLARRLIDQARYWQSKNRDDLAAEAWRKLLRANPTDPLALIQLGTIEARAGHVKEAQELYATASKLSPQPAGLNELATALKLGTTAPAQLSAARQQAQSGKPEEAVKAYREVLGTAKPGGEVGLEYYLTLAGTREGWDEARRGLEELARANPGDVRYLLALARHLTYREPTRPEGIRQLAALAAREPAAQKPWRQALVWLGARPGDRGLFQAYLSRYPGDQAVIERLKLLDHPAVVYRPSPQELAIQSGFRMLEQGDVEEAEARFNALLAKNPRDTDALGGLGTVRLRQGNFDEAARLLDQALQSDKRGATRWKTAANSAHYWSLMQDVIDARQAGRLSDAEGKLQLALRIDAKEPTGQVMLADLYAERREAAKAESIYRQVLRSAPQNPGAFRGLVSVLVESGRESEAMRMVSALDPVSAQRIGGLNQVKAAALIKLAEADEKRRDYEAAAERLEDALLLDPMSPWVRLALSRQYQNLGDTAGANGLLDNLLDTNPDLPEALQARAFLFAQQQRWSEGLMTLERIPASKRTAEMAREQRRFWINVQVQRAQQFFAQGNSQRANALMAQAEAAAAQDTALLGVVAGGWSELSQPASALRVMRAISSRAPNNDIGTRIQYAWVLLGARQDVELSAILRELAGANNLSPAQQDDVNKIILAYTLRQTESLREAGRLSEAYDAVVPALEQSGDTRLLMALARIYNTGGDPAQALQLAEAAILREPDNLDYRLFASGMALGTNAKDKALGHAQAALELAPDHPRALAAAGRAEKARGDLSKAMKYFQAAQALEREKGAFANVPGNLSLRLVDENPAPTTLAGVSGMVAGRPQRSGLLPLPDVLRRSARAGGIDPAPEAAYVAPAAVNPFARPETRSNVLPLPASSARRVVDPVLPLTPTMDLPQRPQGSLQRQAPAVNAFAAAPALSGFDPAAMRPASLGAAEARRPLPDFLDPPVVSRSALSRSIEPTRVVAATSVTPTAVASAVAPAAARERTMSEELSDIKLKFTSTIDLGVGFRNNTGEAGMSRLTEIELPLEVKIPIDYQGSLTLRLTPVMLSAGTVNLQDPRIAARFGSEAGGPFLAVPHNATSQDANGLALSAAYRSEHLNADIGSTPRGFNVTNLVGGVSIADRYEDFSARAGINRRAVTDSLLSYAGAIDPRTGQAWGGVVKTGLRLDASYGDSKEGLYANAAYSGLTGTNVKSNTEVEASVGGYMRAYQTPDTQVTVGVNLSALGYRYNLGAFTLGHGGYFSPQRYISLGLPFDIAARRNRFSYQLGGDIGLRRFATDRTPYFPTDAAAQANWEAVIAATPPLTGYPSFYEGDTVTGFGYNFYGSFEYLLAPKFSVGGRLGFDNSRNYSQQSGMLYLRYAFDGLPQPVTFPPRTLRALSNGDPQ